MTHTLTVYDFKPPTRYQLDPSLGRYADRTLTTARDRVRRELMGQPIPPPAGPRRVRLVIYKGRARTEHTAADYRHGVLDALAHCGLVSEGDELVGVEFREGRSRTVIIIEDI